MPTAEHLERAMRTAIRTMEASLGTVYLVRHAESRNNVERLLACREVDEPLTARGQAQARALAAWFDGRDLAWVYTSPILRARQTAEHVASATSAAITETDALREFGFGGLDGRGDEEAWAAHDRVIARWWEGDWDARYPGGESGREVCERFSSLLAAVARRHADQPVALVGHGGLFCTTVPLQCAVPTPGDGSPLWLENTAVTTLRHDGNGQLTCDAWGSLEHLGTVR